MNTCSVITYIHLSLIIIKCAGLLTGRHPSRFGILGPISGGSRSTLPKDTLTLAEFLKENGYHTAITGKWHLGLKTEDGPLQHGFDYSYGYFHGQIDPYTHLYKQGDKSWHRNDQLCDEEGHATDLITNEANKYITEIRDKQKPFFLYVAYSAPHFPIQEEQKWLDEYPDIENESRRQYAASMTHMDDGIGKIMDTLEKNKLTENLLIIYLSDNGAQKRWKSGPTYYDNKFPPADVLGDNSPLRGWKAELYEGAIRVPALFYWKNKFQSVKINEITAVEDIYPTIAKIIGKKIPDTVGIEGESLLKSFDGEKMPERLLYWRTDKVCGVRKGDWKLIHVGSSLREGVKELYNLKKDPYEKENLLNKEKDIAKELILELEKQIENDPN
ncbi:sulfatase-like hydrolase/transferase [Bacteroidota bacterium]